MFDHPMAEANYDRIKKQREQAQKDEAQRVIARRERALELERLQISEANRMRDNCLLELGSFTFTDGFVRGSELLSLLTLAQKLFNTNMLLVTALGKFHAKTGDDLLTIEQTFCLQRIVDDYQIGLLGTRNPINDIVVSQLLGTKTLSQRNAAPSFQETMTAYVEQEYRFYAQIMRDLPDAQVMLADLIIDFMKPRHINAACPYDATYAPLGKLTLMGLKRYLLDNFGLVSQRETQFVLSQTRRLRQSLEQECAFFFNYNAASLKQIKIEALNALETRIVTSKELPECVANDVKARYPLALNGLYSRTNKLLMNVEMMNNMTPINMA